MARRHQESADIGVAETEGPELVGELRDLLRRELRHLGPKFRATMSTAALRAHRIRYRAIRLPFGTP